MKTILFVWLTICSIGATAQDSLTNWIRQQAKDAVQKEKIPGILVAWSDGSTTSYFSSGYAVPAEKKTFDKYTRFEAGSITKTFTAYVLEKVLQEKGLTSKELLIKFLPDSVAVNKALANITLLQLLNHSSGLPRMPVHFPKDAMQPYSDLDLNVIFRALKYIKPKPEAVYDYSNLGFALAGIIAERISGQRYQQLIDKYIFQPWKLSDSMSRGTTPIAQGYFAAYKPTASWQFDAMAPAGALVCDAREMMNYFKNMSNPADTADIKFINSLLEPTAVIRSGLSIAKAWHISQLPNQKNIYWHNGGTYGFSTFGGFAKGTQQAVLVVINQSGKNAIADKMGFEIMEKMLR